MTTPAVLHRLEQLGHPLSSHASTVAADVADAFLQAVQEPQPPVTSAGRARARLLAQVRTQGRGILWALLLAVVGSGAALLAPFPLKWLADDVLGRGRAPSAVAWLPYAGTPAGAAAWLALVTLVLFAVSSALNAGLTMRTVAVSQPLVYGVSRDVLRRLLRRSPAATGRGSVGDSLGRVMVDPYGVTSILFNLTVTPAQLLLSVAGAVLVLHALDGTLAWVALIVAAGQTGTSFFYGRAGRAAAHRSREAESRLQAHVHHLVTGLSVVQAFVQEKRESERFQRHAQRAVAARQRAALVAGLTALAPSLAGAAGAGIVLYVGALRVSGGQLTVGGLLVFLAYVKRMQDQIAGLARLVPQVNQGCASLQRVLEVLEAEPEVVDRPGARPLVAARGHLVVEDVVFGYEPDRPVLQGVSLQVRPGETLALVGPSGAGKTTLMSLIPRFSDPWSGRVLLDGRDVRDIRLHDLRSQVSVVLQEPFLFPMTIADNIAFIYITAGVSDGLCKDVGLDSGVLDLGKEH